MKPKNGAVSSGLTMQYILKVSATAQNPQKQFGLKDAKKYCKVLSGDNVLRLFEKLDCYPKTKVFYFVVTLNDELAHQKNHLKLAHSKAGSDKGRREDLKQALDTIKKAITALKKFKKGGLEFPHPKNFSNTAQRFDAVYFQGMATQIAGEAISNLEQLCETVKPYTLTGKKRGRRFADEYNFVARIALIYKEILGTSPANERPANERNLFDEVVIVSLETLDLPHEAPARAIKKALEKITD